VQLLLAHNRALQHKTDAVLQEVADQQVSRHPPTDF
jgi:hypothetical protein